MIKEIEKGEAISNRYKKENIKGDILNRNEWIKNIEMKKKIIYISKKLPLSRSTSKYNDFETFDNY